MAMTTVLERTVVDDIERDARRLELEHRLERGFQLIDRAREAGNDVDRWEQRWLRLLREYERLCDESAAA